MTLRAPAALLLLSLAAAADPVRPPYPEGKVAQVSTQATSRTIFTWDVMLEIEDFLPGLRNTFPEEARFQAELHDLFDRKLFEIIQRTLLEIEAKVWSFSVAEQELDALEREQIRDLAGGDREAFKEMLLQKGITIARYREMLRGRILSEKVIGQNLNRNALYVSPEEIRDFFDRHPGDFARPARVRARIIPVEPGRGEGRDRARRTAESLCRQAREGGADIEKLAQWATAEPEKALPEPAWIEYGLLDPALAEALKGAKEGEILGPIEGARGFYIAVVRAKEEPRTETFEQAQDRIQENARYSRTGGCRSLEI